MLGAAKKYRRWFVRARAAAVTPWNHYKRVPARTKWKRCLLLRDVVDCLCPCEARASPAKPKVKHVWQPAPEDAVLCPSVFSFHLVTLCQRALGRSETTHRLAPKDAVSVWCVVVVVVVSLLFRGEPLCARGRCQEFPLLPLYIL